MSKEIRIVLVTLLVVVGVLVILPSGYLSAGGAIMNSGFEWEEGGGLAGWNITGNATRVDTPPIHSGNWSAQLKQDGDTLTQWVVNCTRGITYEVWGWIYVSGNVTGAIAVDFWLVTEDLETQLSPTHVLSTTDTDGVYVQKRANMRAPTLTTHARVTLLGTGWTEGSEEVRFDDIGFWVAPDPPLCFIATAAYDSPMAEEIQVLREFRDAYLVTNPGGKAFVDFYYRVSPPIARFIDDHPGLKPMVRAVLAPAIAMSTIAVNTTLAQKMAVVGGLALVSAAALLATRRRAWRPHRP